MTAPHLGSENSPRIAIIGGGISGLAAALWLTEQAPQVHLHVYEAADRVGGVLRTFRRDGYLLETSADNFLTNIPWGLGLCRRVGLEHDLLETNAAMRRALVIRRGKILPVPEGFSLLSPAKLWPMLASPILSPRGKLRLMAEPLIPARTDGPEESLAEFSVRRLGREAFERIVQPLVGGIYTADPEKLSVAATLPRFLEMEREHGSLTRGARRLASDSARKESGARYSLFVAPREGMESLVRAMAARLPNNCIRLNAETQRILPMEQGWKVQARGSPEEHFDGVLLALPAYHAAKLCQEWDDELSKDLNSIPYASSSVVVLGLRLDQIGVPLTGFGFVVPRQERRKILAASFGSLKFPGRAPEGHVLIRVFLGGACQPELADLPDAEQKRIVLDELRELLKVEGSPTFMEVLRWPRAMPQYHVGHVELVERIMRRANTHAGLALAGSGYEGVGVPHCIHHGERAAENLTRQLGARLAT